MTRGRRRATTSTCSAPTCSPRRCSGPGERERRVCPAGRALDRLLALGRPGRGRRAATCAAPRELDGGRDAELPAPLDELPLLVRAGAVLPLLRPDVDTLTDYGAGATVRLRDRADRLRLLAWPRGHRRVALGPDDRDHAVSAETRRGWVLKLRGTRTRTYRVEAALGALRRGAFRPCRVLAGRRGRSPLSRRRWRYDRVAGVLTFRLRARTARVQVLRRC